MGLATLRTHLLESLIYGLRRHAPPQPSVPEHLATGRQGELAALFYLRRRGYTVVARDWKSARVPGDIDLIAWDGDTVCFVEVKTRTTRDVSTAEAAVDSHKRRTLRRLAEHYLRQLPEDTPSRFDVLSIYYAGAPGTRRERAPAIDFFAAAFDWSEAS